MSVILPNNGVVRGYELCLVRLLTYCLHPYHRPHMALSYTLMQSKVPPRTDMYCTYGHSANTEYCLYCNTINQMQCKDLLQVNLFLECENSIRANGSMPQTQADKGGLPSKVNSPPPKGGHQGKVMKNVTLISAREQGDWHMNSTLPTQLSFPKQEDPSGRMKDISKPF